jgi:hypothetical protein
MKKLLLALALTVGIASPAYANKVYERSFGAWTISGFVESDDRYCVLNAFGTNNERFQINVFPNEEDTNVTMTLKNPKWSMDPYDQNTYDANLRFYYFDDSVTKESLYWQVKDSDRVIFRNMQGKFIEEFMRAKTMEIEFRNQTYTIDLSNSTKAAEALGVCLMAVSQ